MRQKYIWSGLLASLILCFTLNLNAQNNNNWLDTVKAGRFDNGKMWTFNHPPLDYFKEAYNFVPTQEWLNHVRMSALKFADYCSASFISEDGLVLTNHHCGRENVTKVSREGENLNETGFFAATLAEERKVPDLFVQQLIQIIDVTKDVQAAMDKGKTDDEKATIKENISKELVEKYKKELNLECEFVTLYNGGEYSIYASKRFDDVRLVAAPENQMGYFGGDWDNFTFPRYNLDFSMFRVYDENGKPLKTPDYFKWSSTGIDSGGVVFVIGNPGTTSRLKTVAELEFMRDVLYPAYMKFIDMSLAKIENERKTNDSPELENKYFEYMNSQKVFKGTLKALNDPYLMARKKAFEKDFRSKIDSDPMLKAKYSNVWVDLQNFFKQGKEILRDYEKNQKIADAKNSLLGRALFEVYGNSIPPDATFTLRIADGVVSSYEYNGTIAPVFTTFYGMYDRYYGFKKNYPWNLPEKWQTPPDGFRLETPIDFISTNDIVGGNSGSPVVNKDGELVGLAFDGNIESLSSDIIFTTEANRMIAVDIRGIKECLGKVYKIPRIINEIENGKIGE